jgi:dolichyl-phosphate beta-glucosyltransferase
VGFFIFRLAATLELMKISIVIPAYNEERRLDGFLNSIASYLNRHRKEVSEIIIIDDGSKDDTVAVAEKYRRRIPILRVLKHKKNRGKGAAVQTGVMGAKGDYIIFMDADGATDIGELPKMLAALLEADVGVGNRWMRGAKTQRHSTLRKLAGWTYRTYMRLFRLGKIDTMCGFKGYRRAAARDLFKNLLEERWLFDTEIAYKAVKRGYKIKNFPIRWESKDGSKLPTKTLIKSAFQIWPLVRRIRRQEAGSKDH